MTDLQERGERLKKIAKHYRMKQNALAELLTVSPGYVSKMMKGKENITHSIYDKLSNIFPLLNINWLLKGEGPMLLPSYGSNDVMSAVREPDAEKESDVFSDLRRVLEYYKERIDNLEKRVSQLEGRIK